MVGFKLFSGDFKKFEYPNWNNVIWFLNKNEPEIQKRGSVTFKLFTFNFQFFFNFKFLIFNSQGTKNFPFSYYAFTVLFTFMLLLLIELEIMVVILGEKVFTWRKVFILAQKEKMALKTPFVPRELTRFFAKTVASAIGLAHLKKVQSRDLWRSVLWRYSNMAIMGVLLILLNRSNGRVSISKVTEPHIFGFLAHFRWGF